MLESQVSDLTCSLDKFTHSTKMLDSMVAPKRAYNDKSGIGFDNNEKFGASSSYNRVAYTIILIGMVGSQIRDQTIMCIIAIL